MRSYNYEKYRRLTITLPEPMIKEIDDFAKSQLMNRSELIRHAVTEYIRVHKHKVLPRRALTEQTIERMRREFPHVYPEDLQMLQFLTYYKYSQSRRQESDQQ